MSEVEDEINRIDSKIRILLNIRDNGYYTIIAEGDPDFPEGLKFPLPKTWIKEINKAIRTLRAKRKDKIASIKE